MGVSKPVTANLFRQPRTFGSIFNYWVNILTLQRLQPLTLATRENISILGRVSPVVHKFYPKIFWQENVTGLVALPHNRKFLPRLSAQMQALCAIAQFSRAAVDQWQPLI